jgi:hypothetical protein
VARIIVDEASQVFKARLAMLGLVSRRADYPDVIRRDCILRALLCGASVTIEHRAAN